MGKSIFEFGDKFGYVSPWEEGSPIVEHKVAPPKISLKCPGISKVKIDCIVDIFIKVDGTSRFWWDYYISLSTTSNSLKIYDDRFDVESGYTIIAPISNSQTGTAKLIVTANDIEAGTFTFEFVEEKSAFTRVQKDIIVGENESLVGEDKVCFRVADKELAKLLNDPSLVLKSYADLSGYSRMDSYAQKNYIYKSKKFIQNVIWKRHTEGLYKLVPYEFADGQETCFSAFVKSTMTCLGIHVYHFILLNGYHVLVLLVDNTRSCNTRYKILDQLKIREWEDLSKLDQELLAMTRRNYEGACDAAKRKDIDSSINLCKIKSR